MTDSATTSPRVTIDGRSWHVPAPEVAKVVAHIEQAMTDGVVTKLSLYGDNGAATVLFNGRLVSSVVVEHGGGPRPTEISGRR